MKKLFLLAALLCTIQSFAQVQSPDFLQYNIRVLGILPGDYLRDGSVDQSKLSPSLIGKLNGIGAGVVDTTLLATRQYVNPRFTLLNTHTGQISTLNNQMSTKEPLLPVGSSSQILLGNKSLATLNQDIVPDGTTNKAYTATEKTKLAGIANGATNVTNTNQLTNGSGYINQLKTINGTTLVGTGDITISGGTTNASDLTTGTLNSARLPDVTGSGTVGSSTLIPIITYDAKGRVTGVSSTTITQPNIYIDNVTITGDVTDASPLVANYTNTAFINAVKANASPYVINAVDANNSGSTATYLLPTGDQGRIFLGNSSNTLYSLNMRYVSTIEAMPGFALGSNNLGFGLNSDNSVTRQNSVQTYISSSSGTGTDNGFRWLGNTAGYTNIENSLTYMVLQRGLLGIGQAAAGTTITPTSKIDVNGSVAVGSISTKTANYTATIDDNVILVDATSGAITITLPDYATCPRREYLIKRISSAANNVTIANTNSKTIDGATTYVLSAQWKYVRIKSDGTNGYIIGNN